MNLLLSEWFYSLFTAHFEWFVILFPFFFLFFFFISSQVFIRTSMSSITKQFLMLTFIALNLVLFLNYGLFPLTHPHTRPHMKGRLIEGGQGRRDLEDELKEKQVMGRRDLEDWDFDEARAVVRQLWQGKVFGKDIQRIVANNKHNVTFTGHRTPRRSRHELLCQLKSQTVRWTLDGKEPPFSSHGWDRLVPPKTLEELYTAGLTTCAVVSSAGSILNSALGKDIGECVFSEQ